jgi:hypothetical protein
MGGNWESMQQTHNQVSQNGGMGAMHEWMHQDGGVHETTWAALAEQLGLTSKELTSSPNGMTPMGRLDTSPAARLSSGQSLSVGLQ